MMRAAFFLLLALSTTACLALNSHHPAAMNRCSEISEMLISAKAWLKVDTLEAGHCKFTVNATELDTIVVEEQPENTITTCNISGTAKYSIKMDKMSVSVASGAKETVLSNNDSQFNQQVDNGVTISKNRNEYTVSADNIKKQINLINSSVMIYGKNWVLAINSPKYLLISPTDANSRPTFYAEDIEVKKQKQRRVTIARNVNDTGEERKGLFKHFVEYSNDLSSAEIGGKIIASAKFGGLIGGELKFNPENPVKSANWYFGENSSAKHLIVNASDKAGQISLFCIRNGSHEQEDMLLGRNNLNFCGFKLDSYASFLNGNWSSSLNIIAQNGDTSELILGIQYLQNTLIFNGSRIKGNLSAKNITFSRFSEAGRSDNIFRSTSDGKVGYIISHLSKPYVTQIDQDLKSESKSSPALNSEPLIPGNEKDVVSGSVKDGSLATKEDKISNPDTKMDGETQQHNVQSNTAENKKLKGEDLERPLGMLNVDDWKDDGKLFAIILGAVGIGAGAIAVVLILKWQMAERIV